MYLLVFSMFRCFQHIRKRYIYMNNFRKAPKTVCLEESLLIWRSSYLNANSAITQQNKLRRAYCKHPVLVIQRPISRAFFLVTRLPATPMLYETV